MNRARRLLLGCLSGWLVITPVGLAVAQEAAPTDPTPVVATSGVGLGGVIRVTKPASPAKPKPKRQPSPQPGTAGSGTPSAPPPPPGPGTPGSPAPSPAPPSGTPSPGSGGPTAGGSTSSTGDTGAVGNPATTVGQPAPRVTVTITSPTQTPCTLPDGTPGVQVVTAPVNGTTFDSICVRPTDPVAPDTVVIQAITIDEALGATDFPRITAHTNPGPHAGLPGVEYEVHLSGVTQPTIAPAVRGITLHGRATATRFSVSTDTGSNQGSPDPDGHFTCNGPGTEDDPVGSLVWQTGGMKQITVVTSWHLEYWMTFPNGRRQDIGQADTTVTDQTPHPIFGLTTQITSTE
jgi:hypothetical protein